MIQVAIVEDQAILLAALAALLELESDITVTGQYSCARHAAQSLPALNPDIVLSDIEMPEMNGLALAQFLMDGGLKTKVILLTAFARAGYVGKALELGVPGYLLKESPPERLISAIRNVMAGLSQIDSRLLHSIARNGTTLSERDRIILRMIRGGAGNKRIADILGLSPGTVRNYVSEILSKLGASNRVEACRFAEDAAEI